MMLITCRIRLWKKYSNVELLKQICIFPQKRQEEINEYKFPKDSNIAIVVGDNKSNNATKLKELLIRREIGDVVMLNEVVDLNEINFEKYNNIYITLNYLFIYIVFNLS